METTTTFDRLPRGRHNLSRAEIERSQRRRILAATAAAMHERGYAGTSVADVLVGAGVSRDTFYRLYASKLDCFLAAFDHAGDVLVRRLATVVADRDDEDGTNDDAMGRFERALGAYLEVLAAEPALARLFLVEVYAAGPAAIERRVALQQRLVEALADLLDARTDRGRFACQMIVSATSALVTPPLVANDLDALRALGPRIIEHVAQIWPAVES